MSATRVFHSTHYFQPADGDPIRSLVTHSADANIVAWHVNPGQRIKAHVHPQGQDTWTILAGEGEYFLDREGTTVKIRAGDILVAHTNEVHGVHNSGDVPLVFISVVCPAEAGFEQLEP